MPVALGSGLHESQQPEIHLKRLSCNCTPRTPNIMSNLICDSIDSWTARRPVSLPVWDGPDEPIITRHLSDVHFERKLRLDGINSSVDESRRHGNNSLECTTNSDNLENHSRLNSGYESQESTNKKSCGCLHSLWKQRNTELHGTDAPFH
jgi:hypothetical protein